MKKSVLVVLSLFASLTAQAANEGPQGIPYRPDGDTYVIAEVVGRPGLTPFPEPSEHGIRVRSDGTVIEYGQVTRVLTHLSRWKLRIVKAQIQAINETELVDQQDGQPRCTDAPSRSYFVQKSAAETQLEIAAWAGCHTIELKNGAGRAVKNFLDQLITLARQG